MSSTSRADDPLVGYLIGLDIGGSTSRGVLFHNGRSIRRSDAGSSNTQNVSARSAIEALHAVLTSLDAPPGTPVLAGAGGVDTPHDAARLESLIRQTGAVAAETFVRAVHDTRLVLAAGGHTTGVALIAGTGSVAWGVDAAGTQARAGGWGHLLGDEGSGYWMGREAVRCLLRGAQQLAPEPLDDFDHAVLNHAGAQTPVELIEAFHSHPNRTHWAQLAEIVTRYASGGHARAQQQVGCAAEQLFTLVTQVTDQLQGPLPIVMSGGLSHSAVGQALANSWRQGTGTCILTLETDPVQGAPLLATRVLAAQKA